MTNKANSGTAVHVELVPKATHPNPVIRLTSGNDVAQIEVTLTLIDDLHRWDVERLSAAVEQLMSTAESCLVYPAKKKERR